MIDVKNEHTITIIYEDEDFLVIDKPSGITVNKSDTTKGVITVQDWAEEKLKVNSELGTVGVGNDFSNRAGIVHRIDKETSGILLIAKNPQSFLHLQGQFKERRVKKTYLTLVHGNVAPQEGEVRVPVGRLPWNRKQFGVVAGGREAISKYKVLQSFSYEPTGEVVSLVEVYPETGRTHQIRVHMKYIGHPVFGDYLYAGRKTQRNDRKELSRVFLHAHKISFFHPRTELLVSFESPLPYDLERIIKKVQ